MKQWSKSVSGALKITGIFALLFLALSTGFAEEAAPAAEAVEEAAGYADLAAFESSPGYVISRPTTSG